MPGGHVLCFGVGDGGSAPCTGARGASTWLQCPWGRERGAPGLGVISAFCTSAAPSPAPPCSLVLVLHAL